MGWTNGHLYEIRARDVGWGSPDPDFGVIDVLEDVGAKSLKYLYDFGDGWEHSVRIERITGPALSIPASSMQPDAARQRMSAAPGDTASSSLRSLIQTTRNMPRCCNGSVGTSIQTTSTPRHSLRPCAASPRSRPADHRPANAADPRSSPDEYEHKAHEGEDFSETLAAEIGWRLSQPPGRERAGGLRSPGPPERPFASVHRRMHQVGHAVQPC
jgi:hypothetical protein